METLKQEVEKTVRKFYGFGSNIAVNNVEVQFGICTQTNGMLPISSIPKSVKAEKRPYKKREAITPSAKSVSKSLHREYTTSAEDIAVMRHFFAKWERDGKLTSDQSEVINRTKGIRYPMLTDNVKSEMLRLFESVRDKKLFTKENESTTV